jgi:catechol 2,3-dioxygenase-like lactoylglutathione lyase family enzyme
MLKQAKVISFIATRKPAEAKAFYRDVLRLSLRSEDKHATVFDLQNGSLRITPVEALVPAPFTVLGWEVGNIREAVKVLGEFGVDCQKFPGLEQDRTGIWTAPGGAKVAWFKDPDGNILSLTELPGEGGEEP